MWAFSQLFSAIAAWLFDRICIAILLFAVSTAIAIKLAEIVA